MAVGIETTAVEIEPDGYVQFLVSGQVGKGEYHCSECRYGVTVYRELPICPMCGGTSWEQTSWSPVTRALAAQLDD